MASDDFEERLAQWRVKVAEAEDSDCIELPLDIAKVALRTSALPRGYRHLMEQLVGEVEMSVSCISLLLPVWWENRKIGTRLPTNAVVALTEILARLNALRGEFNDLPRRETQEE